VKAVPMALKRAGRFVREGLGRTAVAYAVLGVALVLTGLCRVANFSEQPPGERRAPSRMLHY
jgi:hypothetical protein